MGTNYNFMAIEIQTPPPPQKKGGGENFKKPPKTLKFLKSKQKFLKFFGLFKN